MEHVCRTCLRIIKGDQSVDYLNEAPRDYEPITLREKLLTCVPELTIDIVLEPTICSTCSAGIALAYQFKSTCLETEKTLFKCIQSRKHTANCTDLLSVCDLLQLATRNVRAEHNYSYVEENLEERVSDSEPENECSLRLPSRITSSLNECVELAYAVCEDKSKLAEELSKLPAKSADIIDISPKTNKKQKRVKVKKARRKLRNGRITRRAKSQVMKSSPRKKMENQLRATKNENKRVCKGAIHHCESNENLEISDDDDEACINIPSPATTPISFEKVADTQETSDPQTSPKKTHTDPVAVLETDTHHVTAENTKQQQDQLNTTSSSSSSLEICAKRKQRKQAKPKKKIIEESNTDNCAKIVTYPELIKSPPRTKNNTKPANSNSTDIRNDSKTEKRRPVEDLQEEDIPKRKAIKKEVDTDDPLEQVPSDKVDENHHSNLINNANNNKKKVGKKESSNILTNTNKNVNGNMYDIPLLSELPEQVVIKCDIQEPDLSSYTHVRKGKYPCSVCSKIYDYKCHYVVHARSHILKKVFDCPICDKSFTQAKYLKTHAMIHANSGNYQCEICAKYLSASTALKRHIRTHTGEKPFPCHRCPKRFAQKIQLAVHMRTHTGTKPFSCNECHASFTQKSHLLGHVRTHTGEKPFLCDICPKRFRKSHALQVHKESHSKKPYQCDGCNILFKEYDTYHRHLNKFLIKCIRGRTLQQGKANCPPNAALGDLEQDVKDINSAINSAMKHLDIPDIKKPYLFYCEICSRGFSTKYSRDRHMSVHP